MTRIAIAWLCSCLLAFALNVEASAVATPDPVRVKDLGRLHGWRENALVGWGIVTGLAGTGDSLSNRATRQAMSNLLTQFNLGVTPDQVQSRNVALVMINAALPAFAREGDALDVTVHSAGDARSLLGGSLLLAPLKAANGKVYALAHGPLAVGGYRYDANGNAVQKNHPTVGSIPGGAVVEVGVDSQVVDAVEQLTFILSAPDFTTADRIATAINEQIGHGIASARDASGIAITIPMEHRRRLVAFIARVEGVLVDPDRRARVVINERTGTVVAGGDARISKVAISHGDLRISIATEVTASQPGVVVGGGSGVRTAVLSNTRVEVTDSGAGATGYLLSGSTVSDLVQSLARLRTPTRDVISILRAVKAAGALHAELVIQ